ncbi:response regulator [Aestuariivirga sp.]|uniref:response regulator n=1 Tax=Aestuariivirga sp. TaxID=2650926 RepID=UPI003593EB32
MASTKVSVAFVDDHPVLLQGLVALFSQYNRFQIVASGDDAVAAREIVRINRPDILFMDLSMPGMVFSTISEIHNTWPETKVIIYTAYSSIDSALRALDTGVKGYMLKGCTIDEMFEGIDSVLDGDLYITKQFATEVISKLRLRSRAEGDLHKLHLTMRELQVAGELMNARTNREIADKLAISEKTVKHYMTSLMQKLEVRNRVEAVLAVKKRNISLNS